MRKLGMERKMASAVIGALALVLALNAPGQARTAVLNVPQEIRPDGHAFDGHQPVAHHDFAHHGFRRGFGFALGPVYPYYGYPYGYYPYGYSPYYGYKAPAYYYYCGSLGAYYPTAETCPEGWVPVPVT